MMDHEKKYNINPRIAELILKQKAKMGLEHNIGISNVEAENILRHWANSDEIDTRSYSVDDKLKLLRNIYEVNPNNTKSEQLLKVCNNLKSVFSVTDIEQIVNKMVDTYYRPGIVYHGIRSNNDGMVYFMSQFDFVKMYKAVLINKTFIGDLLKIFPDIEFDKETGEITDQEVYQKLSIFIDYIKQEFIDIKVCIKDDLYIIATDNDEVFEKFKTKFEGLKVEPVPAFHFEWI